MLKSMTKYLLEQLIIIIISSGQGFPIWGKYTRRLHAD